MEQWKPITGYEGLYEVSDLGRVRSLQSGRWHNRQRILKTRKHRCGYLQVILCKDGHMKNLLVHRLVAGAFIPNPNNLETVNHKDEVKTNNVVTNLEWMSKRDNLNYGSHNKRSAEANINNPKKSKAVHMLDKSTGELLVTFPSLREASRVTGIAVQNIRSCCIGKYKHAGGYIWKYL